MNVVGAVVTGWSIHIPGLDAVAALGVPSATVGEANQGEACVADDAKSLLGRKGLLFKEPATRLALCAAHRAMGRSPGVPHRTGAVDPRTAVVASSNLGNVATVADLVRTVRTEGGRSVSPLAAPNASSNVIASAVASWFGWGGPNLMVCSGATAGLDAIALGLLLLAADRADRVVVVGSEAADPVATALQNRRAGSPGRLLTGAACVILEPTGVGPMVGAVRIADGPSSPAAWPGFDGVSGQGDGYGADGIIRVASAVAVMTAGLTVGPIRVVSGDAIDGWRRLDVLEGVP